MNKKLIRKLTPPKWLFDEFPHLTSLDLFKKLSLEKIEILKCLIYINMSPLHEYPFDKLLFAHGKYQLFQTLKKYEYISK